MIAEKSNSMPQAAAADKPSDIPKQGLQVALGMWLLGYYLVPNTMLGRISPGGLIMETQGRPIAIQIGGVLAVLLAALYILRDIGSAKRSLTSPPLWLPVLIYALPLALGGVAYAKSGMIGRDLLSVVTAISVGALAAGFVSREGQLTALLSLIAAVQAVYTIVYFREHANVIISGNVTRAGGTFADPNNLYVLMLVAMPYAIIGAIRAPGSAGRAAYLVASSVVFAALALTWSRGAAAGLCVALVVLSYTITRSRWIACGILACLCVFCLITWGVRMGGRDNFASTQRSNTSRLEVWRTAWKEIEQHPLTGTGVGEFSMPHVSSKSGVTTFGRLDDPKNLLLDWLVERGIGGGLLFALFGWVIVVRIKRSLPYQLAAATAAAWAGLVVAGLVDTPFGPPDRYVGNCCFGVLLAATAMLSRVKNTGQAES